MDTALLSQLETVEQLARGGKLRRWRRRPLGYPLALLYKRTVYRRSRSGWPVSCSTFFGARMQLLLPSGMDIYLTGGKTHDSELRLARWLLGTLQPAHTFVDVGAHYGYFSLLASRLVGPGGSVLSIEASPGNFRLLRTNVAGSPNIYPFHVAASSGGGKTDFYEFPPLYAEYNSFNAEQYRSEPWYADNLPSSVTVGCRPLDAVIEETGTSPDVIKIDVEGAEDRVLAGAEQLLRRASPLIVMEYLSDERHNETHRSAEQRLRYLSYRPHYIDANGILVAVADVPSYLAERRLESDNIVFRK